MHIIRPLHLMLFFILIFMLVFFSYLFRSINGSSGSGRMISVNELPVSGRAMPLGRRPSTNRSTISNFDSGNESRSTTTSTVAAGRIKSVTNAEFAERPPQAYSRFDPKPSLKIRIASAIFWIYLGIFLGGLNFFVFWVRKLKLLASVWNWISWNLT